MKIKKFKKLLNAIKKILPKQIEKAVRSFDKINANVHENVKRCVKIEKKHIVKTEYVRFLLNLDK